MSSTVLVMLNGQEKNIPQDVSVSGLLEHLKMKPQGIAVEINREIVPRSAFETRRIGAGDTIEVLRMVGGG